jgi:hypothetical protein
MELFSGLAGREADSWQPQLLYQIGGEAVLIQFCRYAIG